VSHLLRAHYAANRDSILSQARKPIRFQHVIGLLIVAVYQSQLRSVHNCAETAEATAGKKINLLHEHYKKKKKQERKKINASMQV